MLAKRRHVLARAGIPDEAWFCKSCLVKFGEAGPPAWTAFGPGDRCIATFEEGKNPESKAKWICKVLDIQVRQNGDGVLVIASTTSSKVRLLSPKAHRKWSDQL